MCKFAQAIAVQKTINEEAMKQHGNPRRKFPLGIPDSVIKSVLKMLNETRMQKTEIARQHDLTPSSIYNIRNRFVIAADGSVDRNSRFDNPEKGMKKCLPTTK